MKQRRNNLYGIIICTFSTFYELKQLEQAPHQNMGELKDKRTKKLYHRTEPCWFGLVCFALPMDKITKSSCELRYDDQSK